jgi:hypothetical protein
MTIRIVTSEPRRRFGDRFWPPIATMVGTLLVVGSAISLPLVAPLMVAFAVQAFATHDQAKHVPRAVLSNLWLVWPAAILAVGGPYPGMLMQNFRRSRVLFLRKFGYTDATKAVSAALDNMDRRRWLMVTLDDGKVAGVATRARAARGALSIGDALVKMMIGVAVSLAKVYRVLFVLSIVATIAYFAVEVVIHSGSGVGLTRNVLGTVVVCISIFAAGIVTAVLSVPLFFTVLALNGDATDDRAARYMAETVEGMLEIRNKIRDQTRSFFGSKLVVVTVGQNSDAGLWKKAVSGFALHADAPLIDVSQPTESLVWEIVDMLDRFGGRCVFVGEAGRLAAMRAASTTEYATLSELLSESCVLAYDTSRRGIRRFTRALHATLEARMRLSAPERKVDTLMDPAERADALIARSERDASSPEAIPDVEEAIRIYAELAVARPLPYADKHAQATQWLRTLQARPVTPSRWWSSRNR